MERRAKYPMSLDARPKDDRPPTDRAPDKPEGTKHLREGGRWYPTENR